MSSLQCSRVCFVLCAFLLLLSCQTRDLIQEETDRPNIILFLVDDMGWQDTSVPFWKETTKYNRRYRTPNMERLAAEGMKFTQAYATPVCSPSRISLMTGMNAARHRVTNWTLDKNQMKTPEINHPDLQIPMWNVNGMTPDSTIEHAAYAKSQPQVLKEEGYHTIHAGKAHLGAKSTPAENPLNIGFNVNIAGHAAGAPASYLGEDHFGNKASFKSSPWKVPGLDKYHGEDVFLTEAITQEAIRALDERDTTTPFFLYMSYYGVHTPIMADRRYYQSYLDQGLDTIEARYASMVQAMDKSVGDVLGYLDQHKIAEETIILFMSDNGGLSAHARGGVAHTHNEPLRSGKGSIYEGGIREPMIIRWPGQLAAGSVYDDYLIIEDFYPSVLEMAGIKHIDVPQVMDGLSFVSHIKAVTAPPAERSLYWHYPNKWGGTCPGCDSFSAIRQGDWKLIYFHLDQRFELYDLKEDISEQSNLISIYPSQAESLAADLTEYLVIVDAQMPTYKFKQQAVPWPADSWKSYHKMTKEYTVKKVSKALDINGEGDDPQWEGATILRDFSYPWRDEDAPSTVFRALYDEAYLYFIYHVQDDEIHVEQSYDTDKLNAVYSDRVEIFLKKSDAMDPYYSLEMDASSRLYDSKGKFYREIDGDWRYPADEITIKSSMDDEGYIVEGKISMRSLREFDLIDGQVIHAGLYRGNYVNGGRDTKWISWIMPDAEQPDFHIPSSFGRLILEP